MNDVRSFSLRMSPVRQVVYVVLLSSLGVFAAIIALVPAPLLVRCIGGVAALILLASAGRIATMKTELLFVDEKGITIRHIPFFYLAGPRAGKPIAWDSVASVFCPIAPGYSHSYTNMELIIEASMDGSPVAVKNYDEKRNLLGSGLKNNEAGYERIVVPVGTFGFPAEETARRINEFRKKRDGV